jgi:hypothetical protein
VPKFCFGQDVNRLLRPPDTFQAKLIHPVVPLGDIHDRTIEIGDDSQHSGKDSLQSFLTLIKTLALIQVDWFVNFTQGRSPQDCNASGGANGAAKLISALLSP